MARVAALRRVDDLLPVVERSIAAMSWLAPSDEGLAALAVKYAAMIDADVSAAGWVGPHLVNALKLLGGSPAARKALGVEEVVGGRLAELRGARKRNAKVVDSSAS